MIDAAWALPAGVALGALTGLPLGVVNVAIVEAAARRGARSAAGIGVGGALADGVHAALAFGGVAGVIVARPAAATALHVIAGAVLIGYAVVLWRGRRAAAGREAARGEGPAGFGRGVLTGLGLTLPNPAALGAWIAVAAALVPSSTVAGLTLAGGVALGSGAWFVALARLAAGRDPDKLAGARLTHVVAVIIGVIGAAAIARGLV